MEMESYEMRARFIARTTCRLKQVWKVAINTAVPTIKEMCMWILKEETRKMNKNVLYHLSPAMTYYYVLLLVLFIN
jgi:hypothetical protein